jgi:acyl-CoA synthetase (AMP-forming)/AMP-acid ligase II
VAIFHTSGTAGLPRGAQLSSSALLAGRAGALLAAPLAKGRARALFPLPWAHIMAVSTALQGLLTGAPAYFLPRFEVQAALRAIERHRLNVVVGVPAMFIRLLSSSPSPQSLAGVKLWVCASDHLPAVHLRRLLEYGGLFVNAYGMVELGGVAMFGIASRHLRAGGEFCLRVPPFRVRVADEQGRPTRPGEVGECQIRGPGVTGTYWGDASGAPSPLADGRWLRTGDLAVRNRLGLVRLAGRAKDVIKCGGYSIFPKEVEEVLASHPAVLRAAVIGVPHPEKGEEPVAIVECQAATEEELLVHCRASLAPYKVPRRIHLVEPGTLPQGLTEKVLNRVLRERYGTPSSGAGASACRPLPLDLA